jgi:lysophospholipase L1-like esterase
VLALAFALVAVVPTAARAENGGGTGIVPPKAYYLALGDSLAFGYQQARFNALYPTEDPAQFNTGYVDDLAAEMSAKLSKAQQTVDYGCYGETTASLIDGGCAYHAKYRLHDEYTGSQLAAAVAFLNAHPKQTSPVTLDIGANDLLNLIAACQSDPDPTSCFGNLTTNLQTAIQPILNNIASILDQLQAAKSGAEFVVMGLYNPLFTVPGTDQAVQYFNAQLSALTTSKGARFGDPFPVINGDEPTSVCTLTAVCGSSRHPPDRHRLPKDRGHAVHCRGIRHPQVSGGGGPPTQRAAARRQPWSGSAVSSATDARRSGVSGRSGSRHPPPAGPYRGTGCHAAAARGAIVQWLVQ